MTKLVAWVLMIVGSWALVFAFVYVVYWLAMAAG
jgi:hypothetical protein